jgi:hypothetical protein
MWRKDVVPKYEAEVCAVGHIVPAAARHTGEAWYSLVLQQTYMHGELRCEYSELVHKKTHTGEESREEIL